MKRLIAIVLCFASLALLACSKNKDEQKVATWEGIADVEIFNEIPAPEGAEKIRIASQGDYGADNYVLELTGIMPEAYEKYVKLLKDAGYEALIDNGENGIDYRVYATTLQKASDDGQNINLTLTYVQTQMRLYLSATKYSTGISPYMFKNEADIAKNSPDAKTTLTMQQVPEYGNFFIIQLKNGHFIMNDGGWNGGNQSWGGENQIKTITDVLRSMVPEGETPVVEAWFISHEHEDHMDFMRFCSEVYDLEDRVRVEGFYVSQVNNKVKEATGAVQSVGKTVLGATNFKTTSGETTPVYRPHMGEKYYFNDVVVDVMYTQEQIVLEQYGLTDKGTPNLNNSSTWLMYHIDGQKFLLAGDAELVNMQYVMDAYSDEYLDVDIMNHHHHSLNIYTDDLTYYKKVDTLLYSTWGTWSIYWPADVQTANKEIQTYGKEFVSYVDGGKRFTFPYEVGTYESLEPLYPEQSERLTAREKEWRQNAGLL